MCLVEILPMKSNRNTRFVWRSNDKTIDAVACFIDQIFDEKDFDKKTACIILQRAMAQWSAARKEELKDLPAEALNVG